MEEIPRIIIHVGVQDLDLMECVNLLSVKMETLDLQNAMQIFVVYFCHKIQKIEIIWISSKKILLAEASEEPQNSK